MKRIPLLFLMGLVGLAGCGGGDGGSNSGGAATDTGAADTTTAVEEESDGSAKSTKGTALALGDSEFGQILFDSKRQAIYIFERDEENKSNCYGDCAEAWPPVFTAGKPRAGKGIDRSLLGTTKRRDGKLQVTYEGKPLYFYAHEGPGEVKCHNVNLNGGFWWVLGADGERIQ